MRSYCPYENCGFVKDFLLATPGVFPSLFATAGLSDYRVGYYEAAKWVARLRAGVAAAKAEKPRTALSMSLCSSSRQIWLRATRARRAVSTA